MSNKIERCLFPECGSEAIARGLCNSHHRSISKYVKVGRFTWEGLEEKGKVLPAKKRRGYGKVLHWLNN